MMALTRETPEVKSWIYDELLESGIRLPTVEGFSVRDDNVTALFERLKSSTDIEKWSENEVSEWLEQHEREENVSRSILASTLRVPLYLVLWQDEKDEFRVLSLTIINRAKIKLKDEKLFASCEEFAKWLGDLKGIPVSKGFVEAGRLSSIDRCLRQNNVPWPGNLDGFLVGQKTSKVNVVFELRRTRIHSVKNHNLNDYFHEDFHGWEALDILRNQLNVPLYILTWSSKEILVKTQKLNSVTNKGLEYVRTEFLERDQIVPWFSQFIE
jgi:hypothetical protein